MNTDPLANRLLAELSQADFARLRPSLKFVSIRQGVALNEPGSEIDHIYFPHDGMISLLAVMRDGKAVETATIGREGMVGAMAGLGLHITQTRAVVQTPLRTSQIAAAPFRRAVQDSTTLRDLIVRYNETLLVQVQMTAACNAMHTIEARLARWILQTKDRFDGDIVPLTQEFLSEMLGVRRSSVGNVANRLQVGGLIRYSRGNIVILDRPALEARSCECYRLIKERTEEILS